VSDPTPRRRAYDSPVRRQQVAETRDRIVTAGVELLHGFPIWNWSAVTVTAVAERSGVTERTVYRHFANERELRDAVMTRVEQEVSIDLEQLRLDDFRQVTARVFEYISSFPLERHGPSDPTLIETHKRQRATILAAVTPATEGWVESDRVLVAALLDVLWHYSSYELLVADWELDPKEAIAGVTWMIGLVQEAIRDGRRPRDPNGDA
jgi:AcrR family transcriptional regulator